MNIFINTLCLRSSHDTVTEKRFPLIYFWLKDYYFQRASENFSKTNWSFFDDDMPISKNTVLQEQFKNSPPDIVGLSLYVWNETLLFENARWLKENYPEVLIIAAGPIADANVSFFQTHPYIDLVILGPGAEAFRRVIDSKLANADYKKVDGISYLNNGEVVSNKPIPRRQDPLVLNYVNNFRDEVTALLDKMFATYDRVVFPTLLIQGCPYSCSFCEQGTSLWTKLNWRPVEHLYDEIDLLKNYDNILFNFIDANFGIDKDYEKILDYIIEKNTNGQFIMDRPTMAKNSVDVTFHLLEKIIKNNLLASATEYGYLALQDTNPDVLKLNGRPMSKEFEKIEKLKSFTKNRTHQTSRVEIIIGMPGQSFETLSKTLSDVLKNDLLSNFSTPYLYSIFPNTTLTSKDNQIYYEHNTIYLRSSHGYNNPALFEPDHHDKNLSFKHIIRTETIGPEEIMAAYYMFIMLGHAYGFLGWLRAPLSYLKNYHGISEETFVAAYAEYFAPKNWHLLPDSIAEDLRSLNRWFTGEDKFLQRKDNKNENSLIPKKVSIYRFHADYPVVSKFFKNLFESLIGSSDTHLDQLMLWQDAKTLNFDDITDRTIVSYNYDDIAIQKDEVFYKSQFEFKFNIASDEELRHCMLGNAYVNYVPDILVHEVDANDQLALHINDIKNDRFNSI
jgi:radical SAM superfamily enzyme YgiQ (UPF0313 family)